MRPRPGKIWLNMAELWSKSAKCWPNLAKFDFGQILSSKAKNAVEPSSNVVETGNNWSNFAQIRSKSAQIWPKPAQCGRA